MHGLRARLAEPETGCSGPGTREFLVGGKLASRMEVKPFYVGVSGMN